MIPRFHHIPLALALLLLPQAEAAEYTYTTIDLPFAQTQAPVVTGLNAAQTLVGGYLDAGNLNHGFLLTPGHLSTLLNVTPQAINTAGTIAGFFLGRAGFEGFVFHDGTFTPVQMPPAHPQDPPALLTEVVGMNDAGVLVGDYRSGVDRNFYGFRFDPTTWQATTIAWPGAFTTALTAINSADVMVGFYFDAAFTYHALRVDGGQLTELTVPGITQPDPVGITDDGTIAGNDAGSSGWVLRDGQVDVVLVPDSQLTELSGIRNDGVVYGRYIATDGTHHGFVASPMPGQRLAKGHAKGPEKLTAAASQRNHDCQAGSKRWFCRAR